MIFKNQRFSNSKINLDLNVFQQCTFVDCIFSFFGMGPFILEDCKIERGTLELSGPAAIATKGLWDLNLSGFAKAVDQVLHDIKNPNPPPQTGASALPSKGMPN